MAISSNFYSPSLFGRGDNPYYQATTVASMLAASRTGGSSITTTSGSASLQMALDSKDALASRQRIMMGAIGRVNDIAQGLIQPEAEWEQTAGYMATFGMPFFLDVDQSGQIIVTPQEEDIASLPISQQPKMRDALARIDELRAQMDEENTKVEMRDRLHYAAERIYMMDNQYSPAEDDWEQEFQNRKLMGRPTMVALDGEGNLRAFDQIETNFDYVEDDDDRLKLQLAAMDLENIIAGNKTATEDWQQKAMYVYRDSQEDYFLDIDDDGNVVVRQNTDKMDTRNSLLPDYLQDDNQTEYYIVPEYLRDAGDYDFYEASWEKDVMEMYESKTPFYLDVSGSSPKVKTLDYAAIMVRDLLSPARSQDMIYSQVSLIL